MSVIKRVVDGIPVSDGAGVNMTRVIGQPQLTDIDPFLLLDEFRSDDPSDYIAGFPDHPHRGFQTVTYMLAGNMRHKDNKGNGGIIGPGGVQWMHAGSGIVHSEMPEQQDGLMWGFQLWVNLPATEKMTPAKYFEYNQNQIPVHSWEGGTAKVIAGKFPGGPTGPVKSIASDPTYFDIQLVDQGKFEFTTDDTQTYFLYVYEGNVSVKQPDLSATTLNPKQLAVLNNGLKITVQNHSSGGSGFLLIGGRPFREPIARYGPFVMNTQDELREAFEDFRAGKF